MAEVNAALRDIATAGYVVANIGDELDPDDLIDPDEFINNRDMPEWKQRCIKFYVACVDRGWVGNCYDCIRYCEGQRKWPRKKCHPRGDGD